MKILPEGPHSEDNEKKNMAPNGKPSEDTNGIPKSKAPGGIDHRATSGPDLGKKTVDGEPLKYKKSTNQEDPQDEENEAEMSDDPEEGVAEEYAKDVGVGLGHSGEALARAPMDFFLAIAQGFHNAPRLYGDPTVRRCVSLPPCT